MKVVRGFDDVCQSQDQFLKENSCRASLVLCNVELLFCFLSLPLDVHKTYFALGSFLKNGLRFLLLVREDFLPLPNKFFLFPCRQTFYSNGPKPLRSSQKQQYHLWVCPSDELPPKRPLRASHTFVLYTPLQLQKAAYRPFYPLVLYRQVVC